jgi:ribulose-5-phosphate 4-epimerase/fuculose-1-phosphate aldolase
VSDKYWNAARELISLFQAVGRASLLFDIQDTHSRNMAVLWKDDRGRQKIVITSTGSQKGDLEADHICFISPDAADYGYYKASSESDIHAGILALEGVGASMHCHTKDLSIMTLDDEQKPNRPKPFIPIDPLGFTHLQGKVPVDWVEVPSGSKEMAEVVARRLKDFPVSVIQTHGAFMRGRTLEETFFLASVAQNSGYIARLALKLGIDLEGLQSRIQKNPQTSFHFPSSPYVPGGDTRCDFPDEEELVYEFRKTGARIFESRLSPFHTGSFSVRGVRSLFYASKASMPREIGGPLLEIPLKAQDTDSPELRMHKAIYAKSHFQTVMHCYVPEAEAHAHFKYPGENAICRRIVPIDAEGSFLYLVIPVVGPEIADGELIHLLHEYKVVVVRGGGVWGVGTQSLSEVLHHPSSVREICLYRIGAFQRGLDLKKMEPKKADRW